MEYWFYVRTPSVVAGANHERKFPFASTMTEMNPHCKVRPPAKVDAVCAACDLAFAKACKYSGGRDIVEEMVMSDFWLLGKHRPEFNLVKMKLPVFGSAEGEFVPVFELERDPKQSDKALLRSFERETTFLLGEITDKEYQSRRDVGGTLPRLNRILE